MNLEQGNAFQMVVGAFVKQLQRKTEPVKELKITDTDFTDMIPTVYSYKNNFCQPNIRVILAFFSIDARNHNETLIFI